MNRDDKHLDGLISLAESGEIKNAIEGLRNFTKNHPNKLNAWKWLADLSSTNRERSAAIRRAQLLAPGDRWVIEAKKHTKLPVYKPDISKLSTTDHTDINKTISSSDFDQNHLTDTNLHQSIIKTNSTQQKLKSESLPNQLFIQSKSAKQVSTVKNQTKQNTWLVWIAIIMGILGIILMTISWIMI